MKASKNSVLTMDSLSFFTDTPEMKVKKEVKVYFSDYLFYIIKRHYLCFRFNLF
jgi:hypothetical protein